MQDKRVVVIKINPNAIDVGEHSPNPAATNLTKRVWMSGHEESQRNPRMNVADRKLLFNTVLTDCMRHVVVVPHPPIHGIPPNGSIFLSGDPFLADVLGRGKSSIRIQKKKD